MRQTSALWKELLRSREHTVEYRVSIGSTIYGGEKLRDLKYSSALLEDISVGKCMSATLSLTIQMPEAVPRMAEVALECRLAGDGATSEWLPLGTFFVDTRSREGDALSLVCYDTMLKTEQTFLDPELEEGEWPLPMTEAVSEIARRMGVELDARTDLDTSYRMEYPNDLTMREVLGYIGAAHGGNWCITPKGKLRLVPLHGGPDKVEVGWSAASFAALGTPLTITRVTLWYDDESAFTIGDDTGYHLELDLPWATQAMAGGLLAAVGGRAYHPYQAGTAYLDPAAELGDRIAVGEVESVICTLSAELSAAFTADLSAPHDQEVDHEYPYLGAVNRELKRKVALGKAYYGVSISRRSGLEIKKSDGSSEAVFNSDVLAMRAVINGQMVDCIYFDTALQKYRLTGDVQIDGSLSSDVVVTDALYAEQGDVAQLTVDWIDTSKKVYKYLTGDTTDDNYFEGHDQKLSFVTGSVKRGDDGSPLTEQLYNRYGDAIYWEKDISQAQIVNGYPYIDGERVYTTTKATDYPVLVFQYAILTKRSLTFELDKSTGTYIPVDIYGSGVGLSDPERGRAKIIKTPDGWELVYTTTAGDEAGVYFRDDGFVDWKGRRADIQIDTSKKKFIITPEGALGSVYEITYEETADGLRMTWPDGERFTVEVV